MQRDELEDGQEDTMEETDLESAVDERRDV